MSGVLERDGVGALQPVTGVMLDNFVFQVVVAVVLCIRRRHVVVVVVVIIITDDVQH
jgi:hypothetical protein